MNYANPCMLAFVACLAAPMPLSSYKRLIKKFLSADGAHFGFIELEPAIITNELKVLESLGEITYNDATRVQDICILNQTVIH